MSSHTHNITVPYVALEDFDWSFARSGPLPWNQTVWAILAVFTALPIWTTVELTAWIFYTFRRYKGLYFYSVFACTWGVTIHAIGFILKFCVPQCNWIVAVVLAEIGWVGMVTGFSVVLYSRLNLLVRSRSVRRWTLVMIIADAFLFHVPTIVFQFGVSNKPTHAKYLPYMAPMERVQVMAFSIQETIISSIYIYYTLQYLRTSFQKATRKTIALLISVQVIVILADVIVITLDYCEYFTLKAVLHSFFYAFKLQLEFVILNDVKSMASKGGLTASNIGELQFNISSYRSHSGSESGPSNLPSPPAKASGKKWWSSRLGLSTPPTISSTHHIVHHTHDEKRGRNTTPTSLPELAMSASSRSSETETRRNQSIVAQRGMSSPESLEFITSNLENDIERQYLGNTQFL